MRLAGAIYLHDICDPRLHISLDVFRRLQGEDAENYTILATTKWGEVATEMEERREQLLKSLFRQEVVTRHGSEITRFRGSHMSAWDIMAPIFANQAVVGGRFIQKESVVLGRIFDVGNTSPAELINLVESHKRAINKLKGKVRDDEQQPRLKKNEEELRALLKQIQELRTPPTVDRFLTSILPSMTLERKTNTSLTSEAEWRVRKAQGDMALKWQDFDTAINRYTAAIKLDRSNHSMYSNRSFALVSKQQWKEALNDAEQAIRLAPFIPLGYYRKHHALHGAGRYCEAICSFNKFLDLSGTTGSSTTSQYVRPDTVKMTVREMAKKFMKNTPSRLFNTGSGVICDQPARLEAFEHSMYYMEMVSMITTHDKLEKEAESKVQDYFAYGMLSHR